MTNNTTSSSTTTTNNYNQSSTNTPEYNQLLKMYLDTQKPMTPTQIKAHGEVKTRIGILWFVGIVCALLIIIGGISIFKDPNSAKDVWVIIGPILSSAVTGTVAYFTIDKGKNS
ncbi:hypothetical protein [Ureibacillus sp. FSL K6-0165]|uniref:hypothetical protein n=1 Tax=Ureibacillus sp. FSL K6-0165 TaxID=2954606 RepID=UPI0030F84407